ncbi:hypothetical protein GCM10022415_05340 [Knoellia locipacati]|uniref:2-oxoacid dehydrogenase acyltransferase catalytic domain-containing protein n=1 Tax=Knoellia locipacati TaxID=882824 RepID=A0A512SX48_9MICO|nr:2-oxo acid dehydrogenase subunit E2 [Knoellia locipacati]GEQ12485.1 hypothetical protein KLO01_05320 [Knoellia locipacati]
MSPRSVRRKIAVATWRAPSEGRISARVEVDVSAVLDHVDRLRSEHGVRVTLTHVVGAALGRAMREVPEARARVVFGRIVPIEDCTVAFAVDIDDGADLAPVRVHGVDRLTTVEVARAVEAGARDLRAGEDRSFRRSSSILRALPVAAMRPAVGLASVVTGGLGRGFVGQPGRPLGTAFVSNVGSLGLDEAHLAAVPFARVPVYLAVGAVRDRPVVVDGEVVVRPTVVLVATADHRIVDGVHAGMLQRALLRHLSDPAGMDVPARP